ncbi:MAG: AbrB/MazE/SpoVT family DNA-binding domain-containing protein [Nanoarchaeota archaeon]|nr:AbrB/MazE/SpoVT family DNA-binding domain-containing protein [Nanoarchaeota archaeon]
MVKIAAKVRKWGNSFGIIIPQEVIKRKGIREGEEIDAIVLKKSNVLRETFGTVKFKKSTEQMMRETDKGLYDI